MKTMRCAKGFPLHGHQVRLTGPHGVLIYAVGSIKDAKVEEQGDKTRCKTVELYNFDDVTRPRTKADLQNT